MWCGEVEIAHNYSTNIIVVMHLSETSAFNTVVRWRELGEVENDPVPHVTLVSVPLLCQKLSRVMEIWQSSDKNDFGYLFLRHDIYCINMGSMNDKLDTI